MGGDSPRSAVTDAPAALPHPRTMSRADKKSILVMSDGFRIETDRPVGSWHYTLLAGAPFLLARDAGGEVLVNPRHIAYVLPIEWRTGSADHLTPDTKGGEG